MRRTNKFDDEYTFFFFNSLCLSNKLNKCILSKRFSNDKIILNPITGGAIYSSDEEGSDIEDSRNRKHNKASNVLKDSDEDEESQSEWTF